MTPTPIIDQSERNDWHIQSVDKVISILNTDPDQGLTTEEAEKRQALYGFNELGGDGGVTWLKILIRQLADAMVNMIYKYISVLFLN